jgi:hypothetical protein
MAKFVTAAVDTSFNARTAADCHGNLNKKDLKQRHPAVPVHQQQYNQR